MATRVVVQQRQRLFREGLAQLVGAEDDMEVCGTAASSEDLVRVCAERGPEIVLLEADSTAWDVARLCASLRRAHPRLRVIGLSDAPTSAGETSEARRSGMSALVSREMGIGGILAAVRATVANPEGGNVAVFRRSVSVEVPTRPVLTERELHVLHLVGAGCTSREISSRLGISHKTVENHKQRAFGKLGVQNQAHAISVAMRAGFLRADHVLDLAVAD